MKVTDKLFRKILRMTTDQRIDFFSDHSTDLNFESILKKANDLLRPGENPVVKKVESITEIIEVSGFMANYQKHPGAIEIEFANGRILK